MSDISSVSSSTSSTTTTSLPSPSSVNNNSSDITRMTGLTGFDVDGTVKKLMVPYQSAIDKVKQQQTLIQWQQDEYRTIIGQVNTFTSNYFDITSPNYILSQKAFSPMAVSSSDTTNSVTATANSNAQLGSYSINVSQLATSASLSGTALGTTMSAIADNSTTHVTTNDWSGAQLSFNVGGTYSGGTYTGGTNTTITLGSSLNGATVDQVVQEINKQIATTPLYGKVSASYVSTGGQDYIKLNNTSGGTAYLSSAAYGAGNATGSTGSIADLNGMLNQNIQTAVTTSSTLTSLSSNLNTTLSFNVNYNNTNVNVSLDNTGGTKTIGDIISAINSATGGDVTASLDQISGKFILQDKSTGSSSSLAISVDSSTSTSTTNSTNLLNAIGLGSVAGQPAVIGSDAIVQITSPNGTSATMTENNNNFTLNGVNYSLNKVTSSPVNLTVSANTQGVVDLVTNFVNQYNTLISNINTKYSEKKQYDYLPLTSTQMSQMSATDITNWQNQAHVGLLSGDLTLGNMLNNLQQSIFNPKDKSTFGISLGDIGISTSSDWTKPGQLVVDKDKLTTAIQNNPSQVINLLIQQSSATGTSIYDPTMSSQNRQTRTQNEGIFQRISDILDDNTTTLRDSNGNKGFLLQIAGMSGDASDFNNTLSKQILDFNTRISDMTTKMNAQQSKYYSQFSQMETALQQLNNQSNWLTSNLSGG